MEPVEPIIVTDLFPELHEELIALLRSLSGNDWNKPTAAGAWTVKDIAAHLLDSAVRRLSIQRDRHPMLPPESPIESYRDLVDFLNRLNAGWVMAFKRVSPRLLIEFLSITGPQLNDLFKSLDPQGPAKIAVAWAGDEESANWFDIAREYTERWHHHQQICDAVGASGLTSRKWLFPVLDTFFRGLPHTFRNTHAEDGTKIAFIVEGEAGGKWTLSRESGMWRLYSGASTEAICRVETDQDTAWRLMTKGLSIDEAAARVRFVGKEDFGKPFLGMLSVMA